MPRLKIEIAEPEMQRLRQQPREHVRCTVTENDRAVYTHVGVHVKGAAGSYRQIDDRPALTLNFDRFKKGQSFHGLDKLHLNNSVQDPGYLNELLCGEIFLAAGVPAARTTHARVWLNGRDLGLYVLKEGFNERFLRRHFADPSGNLYESGQGAQDIDGQLRLQSGRGPTDRSDIRALVDACREGDPVRRAGRLKAVLDVDRFLTFMALEMLTCHWDGYCMGRNNYRVYFDPATGRAHFLPHGMDQMFGDPNFPVLDGPGGLACQAVLGSPEWRARYQVRAAELARRLAPPDALQRRVDELRARLRPVLAEMGQGPAGEFEQRAEELKARIAMRSRVLVQQLRLEEPKPAVARAAAIEPPREWQPQQETPGARLERRDAPGGAAHLAIAAGSEGRSVASWRARVTLPAGRYRLTARARAQGVQPVVESQGAGAGIRISGGSRTNRLEGTTGWTSLAFDFEVLEPMREVVLVAELRASAGQVLFDVGAFRLARLESR